MSRSAANSGRVKAGAMAMVLPLLALTACADNDAAMNEKLAAAEAAAAKAIAAQHAAEKAAATAASIRSAPAPEPTVMAPTLQEHDFSDDDEGQGGGDPDNPSGSDA